MQCTESWGTKTIALFIKDLHMLSFILCELLQSLPCSTSCCVEPCENLCWIKTFPITDRRKLKEKYTKYWGLFLEQIQICEVQLSLRIPEGSFPFLAEHLYDLTIKELEYFIASSATSCPWSIKQFFLPLWAYFLVFENGNITRSYIYQLSSDF